MAVVQSARACRSKRLRSSSSDMSPLEHHESQHFPKTRASCKCERISVYVFLRFCSSDASNGISQIQQSEGYADDRRLRFPRHAHRRPHPGRPSDRPPADRPGGGAAPPRAKTAWSTSSPVSPPTPTSSTSPRAGRARPTTTGTSPTRPPGRSWHGSPRRWPKGPSTQTTSRSVPRRPSDTVTRPAALATGPACVRSPRLPGPAPGSPGGVQPSASRPAWLARPLRRGSFGSVFTSSFEGSDGSKVAAFPGSGSRGVRVHGQAADPADQRSAGERKRGRRLRETQARCAVGERADRGP
ncbi:hypothetical protein M2167_006410 [Streptomyces sp. SPB4]|nr:hypothetical protein [Streptomyces sp. SPB4]